MGRQQASAQYRGYRNAGIRLNEDLLPHLYDRPEAVDEIIWAIHDFDKAHLVMLVEEKLIPRESGVAMLRALREMEERGVCLFGLLTMAALAQPTLGRASASTQPFRAH